MLNAVLFGLLAASGGTVLGFAICARQMPRMIARMTPEEIDDLGARVERLRNDAR